MSAGLRAGWAAAARWPWRRPAFRVHPALPFVVVGCIAIGLLAFLYVKTRTASPKSRIEVQELLRGVHQLDADWNVGIMSAKVGLNDSYDPVAVPFQAIGAVLKRLEAAEGGGEPAVRAQLAALRTAFAAKADLVDEFKSRNSVLRNSLRFLPRAAGDASAAVASGAQPRHALALLPHIDGVLDEALRYAVITDGTQREQLAAALEGLREAAAALEDTPEREPVTLFLSHSGTILKSITDEAGLLPRIVGVPTGKAVDATAERFEGYFAVEAAATEWWRRALVGYSALLLVLAAFIANRLRLSYREIQSVNAALLEANDQLELRVLERTRELNNALTSLRESETQLIQSEKMSSLGQMVAGVAHEINTPLAYVRSSLESVSDGLGDIADLVRHSAAMLAALTAPEPDPDDLAQSFAALSALTASFTDNAIAQELGTLAKDSIHGLDQIGEIVVNLRSFSRLDRRKTTSFDLREGLDSTLVIARAAIKGHRVLKQYGDIPQVQCAPSQLNQVFLNLITNAAQALPGEGGVITLSTSLQGEMVRVDVADNGAGIDPAHLGKIFDPFFTTKEIGQGTGLGLSIAYKIMQDHGGRIGVDSTPGQGTVFSLYLPANAHAVPALREGTTP